MLSYFLTSIEPEWGVTILQLFSTCPIVSQVNIIYFSTPYHFIINEYFNITLSKTPVFSNLLSSLRVNWIKFFIYSFSSHELSTPRQTYLSTFTPQHTILLKITTNRTHWYGWFSSLPLFPLSHFCVFSSAPCCPNTPI